MKTTLVLFALFLSVALAIKSEEQYQSSFLRWMQVHQKTYSHNDFSRRYQIFKKNLDYIEAWNAKGESYTCIFFASIFSYLIWLFANGKTILNSRSSCYLFLVALNHFADLTNAEFKAFHLGMDVDTKKDSSFLTTELTELPVVGGVPASVDWRTAGVVTPVKDQGQCGSW